LEVCQLTIIFTFQNHSNMLIQLHDVNADQLAGLRENFETKLVISPAEEAGRFSVSFEINTEIDAWKLFFSGSDYCLVKMGKHVVKS
jgi:hypothetical protein